MQRLTNALEIAGFALVALGLGLFSPALGCIAAGAALLFIGATLGKHS